MRSLALVVSAVLSLGVGCGTTSIGRPPTALDLQNDGSVEAQEALQRKYALAYREGWIERPGALPDVVASEIGVDVDEVRAPAWSDEAADHFAASEKAFEATDTALVGFHRFASSGTPPLIIEAGGVLVGTTIGVVLAIANGAGNGDATQQVASVSDAAFAGALSGLVVSIPFVIVYDWTVPPLALALAASDYRRGVRAYNDDLAARIAKGATSTAPAPPSAGVSSEAPSGGESEPPPPVGDAPGPVDAAPQGEDAPAVDPAVPIP